VLAIAVTTLLTTATSVAIASLGSNEYLETVFSGFMVPLIVLSIWGVYMLRTREIFHATPGFFVWVGYVLFVGLGFFVNMERYAQYLMSDLWQASLLLSGGLLMFIWGYHSTGDVRAWRRKIQPQAFFSALPRHLRPRVGFITAICLGLIGILSMIYIISLLGGPAPFLKMPYGASVLELRALSIVNRMVSFALQTLLPGATTLSMAILIRGGCSRAQRAILWTIVISLLAYGVLSKIRGYIISPFLTYMILRMVLPDRQFRKAEIPKVLVLALSIVFIAYLVGETRKVEGGLFSIFEGQLAGEGEIGEFISGSFDHYYWMVDVMREIPNNLPLLLGWTLVSPFLTLIPRDIWPGKPYGFGKLVLVWQGLPFESPVSTGTLLITELYANFWIPGVLVLMFVQGWLCAKLYRFLLKYREEPVAASLYLTLIGLIAMVRGDFQSGASTSIYSTLAILLPAWIIYRAISHVTNSRAKSQMRGRCEEIQRSHAFGRPL